MWRHIAPTSTPGGLVIHPTWGPGLSGVICGCVHEVGAGIEGIYHLSGLGELHQTFLQIGEGSLHQAVILLVVFQQMVPNIVSA